MYQLENNAIKFVQEHLVSKSLRYILGAREALKQHSFSDMNPQIRQIFLESSRFFSGERGGGIHLRLIYSESWKKQSKAKQRGLGGPVPTRPIGATTRTLLELTCSDKHFGAEMLNYPFYPLKLLESPHPPRFYEKHGIFR